MPAADEATLDRVAVGLLVLAACLVFATFTRYGVTWDEPGLRAYGRLLVDWYASAFGDARAFEFANLRYYGGGFDIVATLLEPQLPLEPYATRHLLGGLVGLLGIALTWRLARRLGGARAGLIAGLLLATMPGWWGHMFFNSKDVPFAVGMLAALLAWVRCLDQWPRPALGSTLLLGLAVGLTLGVRVGGVLLGLYGAVTLLMRVAADLRGRGRAAVIAELPRGLLRLLPALPVALLVLVPAWPWVVLAPGHLFEALAYLSNFPYTADTIFAGQRYPAPAVPIAYWPTLLALQLPEVMLAGLAAAACLLPFSARPDVPARRVPLLLVVIAALFPLLYAMVARPTAYNALRHFIFVLPPLAVLAGLGLDQALAQLPRDWRAAAVAAIAAGLALPTLRIVQLHPYEYIYFNDLSGGIRAADERFELDYWGTSFAELGRVLDPALAHAALGAKPIVGTDLRAARGVARGPAAGPAAGPRQCLGPTRDRARDLLLRPAAARERARPGRAAGRRAEPRLPRRPRRHDHPVHRALSGLRPSRHRRCSSGWSWRCCRRRP